ATSTSCPSSTRSSGCTDSFRNRCNREETHIMLSTRSKRLLALVLGIIVLAGVGVGVAAAKSNDAKKFTVWEDDKSGPSTWFDLGAPRKGDPGSDIGDLLMEHKTLLDPSNGQRVGEAVTRGQVADVVAGDPVINI